MKFLSYFLSGISLGSIYAIIALGYTMVYGIAKMLISLWSAAMSHLRRCPR